MNTYRSIPILAAVLFAAPAAAQVAQVETLNAHNTERRNYPGVAPLQWSPELEQYAQAWANEIAARNSLEHRPNRLDNPVAPGEYVGENIYVTYGGEGTGPQAVQNWISEKAWYDYDRDQGLGSSTPPGAGCSAPPNQSCGHFTQVIWKDTRLVGCGRAASPAPSNSVYVVCNYYPSGNWRGQKPY
jgi:pathogenesis-related protein 1